MDYSHSKIDSLVKITDNKGVVSLLYAKKEYFLLTEYRLSTEIGVAVDFFRYNSGRKTTRSFSHENLDIQNKNFKQLLLQHNVNNYIASSWQIDLNLITRLLFLLKNMQDSCLTNIGVRNIGIFHNKKRRESLFSIFYSLLLPFGIKAYPLDLKKLA